MSEQSCFHCGLTILKNEEIDFDEKKFCCQGCKTVYEIFSLHDLTCYYDFEKSPGATPQDIQGKYDFLDSEAILSKVLEFQEGNTAIVSLNIPHIHCSSCIWILENLNRIQSGISSSQVNFPEKKVRITFDSDQVSLKSIVYMLSSIGYEPYISLENYETGQKNVDRTLTYKLGMAFFCFGNIMLLSFPEYFEIKEFWLDNYKPFFRGLIFILSLPSLLYSASDYYVSAYKSIKSKMLNIDIPIALGIIVMFVRSTFDVVMNYGSGFFDSLTGLIFFMLLGKMFQIKTYSFLSFERDFKSYFPIAVTRINLDASEESVPIYDVEKGNRLLIRNQELIPVDGILISEKAEIDYSFVTGEAVSIEKKSGDKVFAGGKQIGKVIEMEVLFSVSQSYLTQLWSNEIFQKKVLQKHKTITDAISRYFTPILLLIAFTGFGYWIFFDANIAFNVFTAVLIVACPCALALTAPFTFGNILRILGKQKLYLKNALVIEQLAKVDTIVFDKTGTITTNKKSDITYEGVPLSDENLIVLKNVLRASNHPLSRMLYDFLPETKKLKIDDFEEITGKGIVASVENETIQIGSASFVGAPILNESQIEKTALHIKIGGIYCGKYTFKNQYRDGLEKLFFALSEKYQIKVLSGDNDGERVNLEAVLPKNTELIFNQKPEQKLEFIRQLQEKGQNVMMVGDGLNDAGALAQSNVGISISENVNVFSPACDAILDASEFSRLDYFLQLSQDSIKIIKMSFVLSLLYNVIGLSFAITGNLLPLVAAIIMPLSTITIVSFVTLMSNFYASRK
ncbi:heavy metal translocating P-type ATPase metal-binding domain-containing protein [Flavobacterium sp. Fl-77]|uniref:Heavy metal translocating P-type ATPase metal-binding domain-containing protein n=1 Tax=Flavobacterium flavipigmentatum TaxID=2893884 RepID=A0AAJ2SE69_9FLAO|nr:MULTISPECIES: heavy metal translocating P-type ATPase metal-binding domain-containing protein [unclassified Flavobacterium]MDX6181636.1 heavy metal translocating P-type ATPase metal-binding domain-containing protein [Flavobacterium sp. Fl-33]MDX6185330.1 heavy metal translocating P-type ATPase metal-binding domain-containing protein [Flavobacterium sp. Fl-77]UFH37435.1 heavy metal translocating P-type ATPase metal-binding domain-containing protein [Flavobacterium sp. F-70]